VGSDTHLWSETYDRDLEDIFAIQDEIASHIVGELTGILSATVHKDQPTENLEAYNLYLKGRYHWERRGGSIEDAERLLREAVALDPEFSDAYGLLSLVYTQMPNYLDSPLDESIERALNAASRASQLDPHQAEADLARANVAIKQRDVLSSLRLHQGVVERHPHHTLARVWYSVTLTFAGYFEEAEKHLNWVRQRDPISAVNLDWLSRTQTVLGKSDAARRNSLEAIGLGRSSATLSLMQLEFPDGDLGLLLNPEEALPRYLNRAISTAVAIHRGELTAAAAMAPMTSDMDENEAMWTRFMFHMMRRDFEPLIRLAPEALVQDETVLFMFWWPDFKPLRNDPRVKAIQRAYAIPDVWRELGFPESCRPLGDDNWECE
jgi:tetratricopeptide (TPR) repeat protein